MNRYDSHIHIGNYERCNEILQNSQYKFKYKLYDSIDINNIKNQKKYLNTLDDFFAIPMVFKETDISLENKYIKKICDKLKKGIPVYLINTQNQQDIDSISEYNIYKEHFLLHDYREYNSRRQTYQFINDNNGFIIIHCKDKIRLEYLKELSGAFPKINFIVAHLGRNTFEDTDFILKILNTFKSDKFYFDLSTITNPNNIILATKICNTDNLLYGSDFPYVSLSESEAMRKYILDNINHSEKILEKNFIRVREKIDRHY